MMGGETALLVAAAIIAPIVWGFIVSWVMDRLWPVVPKIAEVPGRSDTTTPHDYQV
jgi:hypothetical protein